MIFTAATPFSIGIDTTDPVYLCGVFHRYFARQCRRQQRQEMPVGFKFQGVPLGKLDPRSGALQVRWRKKRIRADYKTIRMAPEKCDPPLLQPAMREQLVARRCPVADNPEA